MYSKKKIEEFEDLVVWQKGIQMVKQIYVVTDEGKLSKDFGLKDQLRRVSNDSDIGEWRQRSEVVATATDRS